MSTLRNAPNRLLVERALISLVLMAAALLKTKAFLLDGQWDLVAQQLRGPNVMSGLIALEVSAITLLWSPARPWGCWAVIFLAVGGSYAYFWSAHGSKAGCGCFGRVRLTPIQHALLCCAIFALAIRQFDSPSRFDSDRPTRPKAGGECLPTK